MFKNFLKRFEDDDEVFETVDPIVEQRRNEKFSKPLIYDEEFAEEPKKVNEEKKKVEKSVVEKPVQVDIPKKSGYEMMDVISPIHGMTGKTVEKKEKPVVSKPKKKRKAEDSLIQVISPYYGNFEEKEEVESEAVLTPTQEDIPTVEDNLRNIARIVEEEQDQLKIIEERTGEFKLDFGTTDAEKQNSLIDEIDDNMSLNELMNLYEKKFKD